MAIGSFKNIFCSLVSAAAVSNVVFVSAFQAQIHLTGRSTSSKSAMSASATSVATQDNSHLFDPSSRDTYYGSNVAKYLVDLHDARATFDFCGGMMFQLVLSDKLRSHLIKIAESPEENKAKQPVMYDSSKFRMYRIDGYEQSAAADNISIFHGREVRQVANAAGGMGFVLHLSHSEDDPEGWTAGELQDYDGWGHDSGRTWRNGDRLAREGFKEYQAKFGPAAFGLHHRFYLHLDAQNRVWLSAEDGCEGTPVSIKPGFFSKLFQ